jgi:hypothetical protein
MHPDLRAVSDHLVYFQHEGTSDSNANNDIGPGNASNSSLSNHFDPEHDPFKRFRPKDGGEKYGR